MALSVVVLWLAVVLGAAPLSAQTVNTYTTQTSFDNALPNITLIGTLENFSGVGTNYRMSTNAASPDVWNGFTLYAKPPSGNGSSFGPSGYCPRLNATPWPQTPTWCIGYNSQAPNRPGITASVSSAGGANGSILFRFSQPVYAFYFTFVDWNDLSQRSAFRFTLSNGVVRTVTGPTNPSNNPPEFFAAMLDKTSREEGIYITQVEWYGLDTTGELVGIWNVGTYRTVSDMQIKKTYGAAVLRPDGSYDLPIKLTMTNNGNLNIRNMQISDAVGAASNFGSAFTSIVSGPTITLHDDGLPTFSVAPTLNPAFNGTAANSNLFNGTTGLLGTEDSVDVDFTVRLTAEAATLSPTFGNTVTASAQDAYYPVTPALTRTDRSTPTLTAAAPALTVTKTANTEGLSSPPVPGNVITYTYQLRNSGNLNLTNLSVTDVHSGTGALSAISPATVAGPLAPGATTTFTASYVLTQADIDTGSALTNTATGQATDAYGHAVTGQGNAAVPLTRNPAIVIDKSTTVTLITAVGQVIPYTIVVTNSGNVTLQNVVVSDPLTGLNQTIASFAPGATQVYHTTHTVTQADFDSGNVHNIASVMAQAAGGGTVTASDSAAVPPDAQPSATLVKSAPTGTPTLGQTLTYNITLTNTGNVTMTGATITDTKITPSSLACPGIAPGATCVLTGTYVVTQADVDAGEVVNTATATAPLLPAPLHSTVVTPITRTPALTVNKAAGVASFSTVGAVIPYTINVTNTGNVTLTAIAVTDPLTGLNQTVASLAPGASQNVATSYTVTQADLDAGQVANTATATGQAPGGASVSGNGSATVPASQAPALAVTKTASLPSYAAVGAVIPYTITVTNTGNVTLAAIGVTDPLTGLSQAVASLAPGASQTLTTSYTVTQADLDAGQVANTATATGLTPGGAPVSGSATANVPAAPAPGLSLDKVATVPSYSTVGSAIPFTITVTNTGNVTLTSVVVTDPLTGLNQTVASLAPGASQTLTTSHTVTQADLDAGQVVNTASASGTPPTGGPVTANGSVTVPAAPAPALSLSKVSSVPSYAAVGDVISYTITVTNTGNVTLTAISVADPLTGLNQTVASLSPGASQTLTTSYTVTQADLDAGQVANTATTSGTPPTGGPVTASGSETVPAVLSPALTVQKTTTTTIMTAAGQVIPYTITVTNTGNVTLGNVVVTDPLTGMSQTIVSLAPAASQVFNTSYTVQQADIDLGYLVNTATATGNVPGGGTVTGSDGAAVPPVINPGLSVVKSNPTGTVALGQTLTYTVTATNTGNITLHSVTVSDAMLTPASTSCAVLAPTASCVLTGSYVVTQADVDAGQIINTGSATSNETPTPTSDTVTTPVPQVLDMAVTKTADVTSFDAVGDVITYTVTVSNPGTVTLTNVQVTDPLTGLNQTVASLAPGASQALTTSYTVTQADLDAGSVGNTASATGTPAGGGGPLTESASASVPADVTPGLTLTKVANVSTVNHAGDAVTYTITVTNTGNVTLSDVSLTDPLTSLTSDIGTLTPGQSNVVTITYYVSQAQIDAGGVTNTASATGTPPSGPAITATGTATVTASENPELTVTKSQPSGTVALGQTLTYTVTARNSGNTTLSNVVVSDAILTPGSITCATLLPNAICTLTGTYVVTQADVDNGQIVNTGSAVSTQTPTPTTSTVTTPVPQNPGLSITKVATSPNFSAVGQTISYTITVANTGTVTLNAIAVNDPLTGLSQTVATLAPGASQALTTSHIVTQADLDAGFITNVASATGTPPSGQPITETATSTVPALVTPGVTVTKVAGVATVSANGDVIPYTITVTNTGNVTLINLVVSDPLTGLSQTIATLAPGASQPVITSYTVKQADLDAGLVANVASVSGTTSGGTPVRGSDNATVTATPAPALTVTKVADVASIGAVGDVVSYTITVTNSGNVTLSNVAVSDPLTGFSQTVATLAAGADQSFTTSYTVTQADLDAGSVVNTALATGTPPRGPQVSDDGSVTVPVAANPQLTVTKNAGEVSFITAGDVITYTITVTNSGNVTLTNVSVTDPLTGLNQSLGTMVPGDTQTVTTTYTITATDVETGHVDNTATATGTPPAGAASVSADGTETVPNDLTPREAIGIEKVAGIGHVMVGQVVPYTITVTNRSQFTTVTVDVVDTMPPGFVYQAGSGRVGATAQEPEVNGSRYRFTDVAVPPQGSVAISISALVTGSAQPGENTNTARAFDPNTGEPLSTTASATVMVDADPVFDCGTVIGRVFDDANQDGYMNGPSSAEAKDGEVGLPAVRLVTVNGTIITTDRFGRYHIPCAELPRDIGTNFILKLDERTLPTGYRLTTENPRVVRLTAGKMTRMNFGATLAPVVRIDLSDRAFLTGKQAKEPRPELAEGLRQMVRQIANTPSVLQLNYLLGPDGEKLAKARMRVIEDMVRELWRGTGAYKLNVEQVIERGNDHAGGE